MNTWKMFTHHIDRRAALSWTRDKNRIAIGWGKVGDISKYHSPEEIKAAIKTQYPSPPYKKNAHLGAPSLWSFYHEAKIGDLIILAADSPRTVVVRVTGDYQFVSTETGLEGEYFNQRTVEVTSIDPNKLWAAAGGAPGTSIYQTLIKCAHGVDLSEL